MKYLIFFLAILASIRYLVVITYNCLKVIKAIIYKRNFIVYKQEYYFNASLIAALWALFYLLNN